MGPGRFSIATGPALVAAFALLSGGVPVRAAEITVRLLNARNQVVSRVALEPYVESVVASEVYADWPAEALRAQAVVARTYALYQRSRRVAEAFDMDSSVLSQRYGAAPVSDGVRRQVAATRGEYLSHSQGPILAVFHSAAGGRTASAAEVWGESLPYLLSVVSPDDAAPDHFWSFEIDRVDFFELLRGAGLQTRDGDVTVTERGPSGRVSRVRAGDVELSGRDLRDMLGGRGLRSTLFETRSEGGRVTFLGSGFGHGVGLSQWGAHALAEQGWDYKRILAHYYPGTALLNLNDADPAAPRWIGETRR